MPDVPLIGPYQPDDVLAWDATSPQTARQFLTDVTAFAEQLPDRLYVVNLAESRYRFFVGFSAAILRGQRTLLPQSRAPQTLRRIMAEYPGSYVVSDRPESLEGIECATISLRNVAGRQTFSVPTIPATQPVAIAFTSGSTGRPMPNVKTWGALTAVAKATGARLGLNDGEATSVVATVPHQHMFGLEASVMLPLVHGFAMHAGRPLFPADIAAALTEVTGRRILVTTPLHIRACLVDKPSFPSLHTILSATAPLARTTAEDAERQWQTRVHEIFGFAEAGSVAERRTVATDSWRPLDGVALVHDEGRWSVRTEYLPQLVPFPDSVVVDSAGTFVLRGRASDQVNIAGHRVSIGDLNQKLLEIEGVTDGVFFLPNDTDEAITRLAAFVVAPGKTEADIRQALRGHLNPVFLPRPLVLVPSLPRNETGKLPREALMAAARHWLAGQPHET